MELLLASQYHQTNKRLHLAVQLNCLASKELHQSEYHQIRTVIDSKSSISQYSIVGKHILSINYPGVSNLYINLAIHNSLYRIYDLNKNVTFLESDFPENTNTMFKYSS